MWVLGVVLIILLLIVVYDVVQTKHAILRNFPIIGHFRYILEAVGPELRQYIVTDNNEERPFNRDQRRWVYASAKGQNDYFGFGTDNDLELTPNHLIVKHSALALPESKGKPDSSHPVPCAKVLGAGRERAKSFRPRSVVNVSAMSFGSLSARAVEALNRGCGISGALHNTGEGGIASYHDHGGDLVYQLGTGYFGARAADGRFDRGRFLETVAAHQVRAVEVKLSQGAKPGRGGMLPGVKVTPEIARARGIPEGKDCISPNYHSAFSSADELLDFVEDLATATGLPVGIKSAIGDTQFFEELAELMATTGRGIDFFTVDGGEGGTGAAPLVFTDHVSLPFKVAMARVHRIFFERELHEKMVFIGSGKLGFPEQALLAFGLGCDLINLARESMLALGCIQAQRCHTDHCPTGVATQNAWLMRGLVPTDKAERLAHYFAALRKEMLWLSRSCGVCHPSLVTLDQFDILDDRLGARSARDVFGYETGEGLPSEGDREAIIEIMAAGGQLEPVGV